MKDIIITTPKKKPTASSVWYLRITRVPPTASKKDRIVVKMPANPIAWLSVSSPESFCTARAMAQMP